MTVLTLEELSYRVLPRVAPGRALADREWTTLVKAAEVLLEGSPLTISGEEAADGVERFLINGRSRRAWRCRALLTLIELGPLPTHRRTFSRLSRAERRRLVEERYVAGTGLWALCAKVRYLVLMGAYGHPDAVAATGFVPLEERPRFKLRDSLVSVLHLVKERRLTRDPQYRDSPESELESTVA